jgi:hypothetical protein
MGSTNTVNGFGWGQRSGYNFQIVHGRRAGNQNFFWVGQAGGMAYTSNSMSTNYEFFNLPRWPSTLTLSLGSNQHANVIHFSDVQGIFLAVPTATCLYTKVSTHFKFKSKPFSFTSSRTL